MLLNFGVEEDSWRVPWTVRRSNQSILKEISTEYSLEGLMLKLKLKYFGHLMRRTDSLDKTLMLQRMKAGTEGTTEDEMVGRHHRHDGHECEEAPATGDGQRSLACQNPWGCKESDMTEWLNWIEVLQGHHFLPCVLVYVSSCVYPTRVEFLLLPALWNSCN